MIRHIIFWKLREDLTGAARTEVLQQIKDGFEAMQGQVPGLLKIDIGIPFSEGPDSADVALYSEFDSRESLQGYNTHPLHHQMVSIVRPVRIDRRVADWEV